MNPLNHVAIIMDGNGRWGLEHFKSRNKGHKEGINTIEKIIRETITELDIKFLTLYRFFYRKLEPTRQKKFRIFI